MSTEEDETTHEEPVIGSAPVTASQIPMPTITGFIAACEKAGCLEASVPETDDIRPSPFREGFCAAHAEPELAKSHAPTCEHCDDAAVQTDPPVTSTQPFRKGTCAAHQPVEAKPGEESAKVTSPVKRPIEHWATVKGMLPRMLAQGKVEQTGRLVPARQNPKFADFHRARQGKPVGHEMTEAEFDKAVADAKTHAFH